VERPPAASSPSTVDLMAAFEAQAARVGTTVHRVAPALAPRVVLEILRDAECRTAALADVVPQRATHVEALSRAGVALVPTTTLWPTKRADAGISFATLGVAETGSVLLQSTGEDRRVELCVDRHLVLLQAVTVVRTLDTAFAALREIGKHAPAYASLVTGPSRSADIERQITIGVHGPRALHILLLEGSA
jgi:L-lactate dehydrogenase complex protein LldG